MDIKTKSTILKSGYVKEQAPYTKSELKDIFQCDDTILEKIIRQLRYKKLLKINKRKDATISDMSDMSDEIVDVRDAINDVNGYRYVFTCVGVLIIGGFVLKCYPKYIDDISDEQDLLTKVKQVLKVLEKHNASKININMLSDNDAEKSFNLLDVILFLLHDYYENGIYTHHLTIIESNGSGSILWDRTVNQIQPIIVNNRPYYTELLTRKRVDEQENYFKQLHKCILNECSKTFAEHYLFELFDGLVPVELEAPTLDEFGDIDYILYRIERELSTQFNTRKQLLLKTMHTYIANKKGKYESIALSVYATTAFHEVWEKVCQHVMQNKLKTSLEELANGDLGPLHPEYEKQKHKDLLSIIEKPEWKGYRHTEDNAKPEVAETLIPDIISIFSTPNEKCFAVLDAKYYKIKFNSLSGQPGIGDITKQYLYNLAYKDFIEKHNFTCVWNCFLMPVDGVEFMKKGYAQLKILQFFNFGNATESKHYKDKIDVILMPATTMYDWYLNDTKWDDKFYRRVIALINDCSYGAKS